MIKTEDLDQYRSLDEAAIFRDIGHLVRESRPEGAVRTLAVGSQHTFAAQNDEAAGKGFWEAFKEAAAERICAEKGGLITITDNSKLEEQLCLLITPLLIAKFGALGGALASIGAAMVILVIKTGIQAFCAFIGQEQGQVQEA